MAEGKKKIKILGVPMDLGADRRGVDMGPSAIRYAGLKPGLQGLGNVAEDAGNVTVPVAESLVPGDPRLKFLVEIAAAVNTLARQVAVAFASGHFHLLLGGDHSITIGGVAGVARQVSGALGLLWLDGHGDCNTPETTLTGNIHGMSLAVCLGYGSPDLVGCSFPGPKVLARHTSLVGVRNLDPREQEFIQKSGITVFTMKDIDQMGMQEVMRRALRVVSEGTAGFYTSLDMDVLDPREAPGVGTPVPGGITYREAHLAMEMVAESGSMLAMDVTEVNPILDHSNKTAQLAVELVLSALGKTIL
ncbi:arginase [Clostridiales bacterium PH28_bin88]|nr:arginase [Clostridiales bacterium PH28_bin88]